MLGQGTMWTVLVVVPGVLGQYGGQVPLAEDERAVGALPAHGADTPLGVRSPSAPSVACESFPFRQR